MIVRRLRLRPGFPHAQPQVTSRMEAAVLVGIFSDPAHVIAYVGGEVRQPVNTCFAGRAIGGKLTTSDEASEVAWIPPGRLDDYDIHPAIRRRIVHGLDAAATPHVD